MNAPTCIAVAQAISLGSHEPDHIARNARHHARVADRAADEGATLVVFPELSLSCYEYVTSADALSADDARFAPIRDVARARGIEIIAGAPVLSDAGLHIGAFAFHPDGTSTTHTKQYVAHDEEQAYVPGRAHLPFALGAERVGVAICADVSTPAHAEAAAIGGATVYVAGSLISPDDEGRYSAKLRRHAMNHRMLTLFANYANDTAMYPTNGCSAVWSPDGEQLACAPESGEALVLAAREPGGDWSARVVVLGASD